MTDDNKVKGYTDQSPDKVGNVNINKELEELVLRRVDELAAEKGYDQRFVSIARTHFQEGFMALNRALFQPKRVEGDLHLVEAWMRANASDDEGFVAKHLKVKD